ncbi:PDZ domain-containing protein [Patescibacteria group bacterium]|nr:PDZ domain-containing protein [Patescibacteria group bacterium]
MNRSSKKIIFIFLIIATSFSAGFAASDFIDSFNDKDNIKGLVNIGSQSDQNKDGLNFGNILDKEDKNEIEKRADFGVFWEAWRMIEGKYTLEDLDYEKMVHGAVSGMVDSLGDPYTVFLSPQDKVMFEQDMKGSFSGIGAEIGFRDKFLTIIAPLKGSPAEKAGLLSGDKILKVDEAEIMGMNIDEAVSIIRGEKGTMVKLTIGRDGLDELKEIEIIRDIIKIETVEWEIKNGNIAYIRISQFKEETVDEFDSQIDDIIINDPKGIIIDLRNNPGGYVSTLEDIASRFLNNGDIIFVEDFGNKKEVYKASGNNKFNNIPIVVLINEGSASASEILAGALKDNNGAKLVGKTTFGKGLVQEMQNLKDGSALKITVAKWLTPSGLDINKDGIKPDYEVEMTLEDYENNMDPQLEKALDILTY